MFSAINIVAVCVADGLGIVISLVLLLVKGTSLPGRKEEGRIFNFLIIATIINCLVDPLVFFMDGKPGLFSRVVVYGGNTELFLYNLVVGTGMMALIVRHINRTITKYQYMNVVILATIEITLLVVNLFSPVVFEVDANNVYSRGPLYFLYIIFALYMLGYGIFIYAVAYFKTGSLRYFPVVEFLLPVLLGLVVQAIFYGISVQPVSFVIAFTSMIICLQKESLYVDKLTGAYNRFELEKSNQFYKRHKKKFAAIMLDMNGFKAINDDYSHTEGDEALKNMSGILFKVVSGEGNVIRFAGDEFILIINSSREGIVEEYIEKITKGIDEYNESSGKPYKLAASAGGVIVDPTVDEDYMSKIDKLMYLNKEEYYQTHDRRR